MDVPEKQIQSKKNQACYFSTNLSDMIDCKSFSNETFCTYRYHQNVIKYLILNNVTSFQVLHIRQVHKLIFFDLYITWYLNKHINLESVQIIYEKVLLESNSFDRGRKIYIHHQSFSRYMNNDNTSLFLY